jgi:RecA/RadA recombinase
MSACRRADVAVAAQAHRLHLKSKCIVIFINQLRMKIGVMYGNPETTTGGNALKFYASVRSTSAAPARSRTATISSATPPA